MRGRAALRLRWRERERSRSGSTRDLSPDTGYAVSQRKRKLGEEIFGWMKTIGGFRRTRFKGLRRTRLAGTIVAAVYNMLRICSLQTSAA